jgi:CO/xanthine dehydrogenase FAD-binding subunit
VLVLPVSAPHRRPDSLLEKGKRSLSGRGRGQSVPRRGQRQQVLRGPPAPEGARQTFLKFTVRKPVDFAIASVASVVRLDGGVCREARIALGAVAPMPVRAAAAERLLRGRTLDEAVAAEAAEAALADATPLSRNAHKIEIAKTLVRRALLA